ncbi:uncharacterized protein NEMAJ01_2144 [Nematocida major]|uniref:uncharacterized protein n=1 Tax=Nematocida major TaxID=1912982 RepID=UPI0020085168|nr:uncharacterized protein NEMAJ01_2144 [Nematocida major]KAH9387248.1 hypothetical protein NEMAJ01_2144 [Nematocida major]
MREILEEAPRSETSRHRVEELLKVFGAKTSENFNVNYTILLHISNTYYKTLHRVHSIQRRTNENLQALYKYNKIKDTAQDILAKIAEIKGITLREVAEEYEAPE